MKINNLKLKEMDFDFSIIAINFDWTSYSDQSSLLLEVVPAIDQKISVQKRKACHLAGRFCAKKALQEARCEQYSLQIPVYNDGSPIWPKGWVGSITHTDDIACAGVAPSSKFKGLGIDIEKYENIIDIEDLILEILCQNELSLLNKRDKNIISIKQFLTLIFSMKESIYKCIYPLVKEFFEFKDVEIFNINYNKNYFEFTFKKKINYQFNPYFSSKGQFKLFDGFVFTLVQL